MMIWRGRRAGGSLNWEVALCLKNGFKETRSPRRMQSLMFDARDRDLLTPDRTREFYAALIVAPLANGYLLNVCTTANSGSN